MFGKIMRIIRHKLYRKEIIASFWVGLVLNLLGSTMLDGGYIGSIIFIGTISFWIGSIGPLLRKTEIKSDRKYMGIGLAVMIGFSMILSPIILHLRYR